MRAMTTRNSDFMPQSPAISKNQNLKDRVLQEVYNRKIKDLISMLRERHVIVVRFSDHIYYNTEDMSQN